MEFNDVVRVKHACRPRFSVGEKEVGNASTSGWMRKEEVVVLGWKDESGRDSSTGGGRDLGLGLTTRG